ncbi:ankyrin repeat-containing domain protein [Aspergillus alliaceus]|uniref:Ankyrin repeat-containing domain protein n=1 Tax=Petromyces alliaceus TaxID=209559 RepID=A0A5N7BUA8_PETAA|nr:ankyrin repeat-containing domain protein [Aspergillus alliaceus]
MVEIVAIRERLTQAARSVIAITRSFGGKQESQEALQKALLMLCEILNLLYQIREQLSWAEDKWIVAPARLNVIEELLCAFEATVRAIESTLQPGGVSSRLFRKGLIERTFIPRLELYKVAFLMFMQPESREKCFSEQQLRDSIRECRDLELGSNPNITAEDDFHNIISPVTSKNFIDLSNMCHRRQKDTCQWIYHDEKYKSWLFGRRRTLYCVGSAGVGKTYLSSSIIETLQNTFTSPDVAVVFFFCQDERDEEASSLSMLSNILAQLVYRKGSATHTTAALYRSEAFIHGKVSAKSFHNAIRTEINHFSKVYIIVDGLDLLPEKDRVIARLQKLPDHAHLLFTLREARNVDEEDFIQVIASRRDLAAYIDSKIDQEPELSSLLLQYPPEYLIKEAVVQQVVDKSYGLFLLARLHMDLLTRCKDANILQGTLLHLPDSLNDSYAESMKQLASQNLYASRCIFWTLYAHRPLTVTELKSAVFFEPQNGAAQKEPSSFEHILHVETSGLLTVDPITATVHLVHRTAKEYLTGAAARVFFPTARKHIAETCLTVITSDEVVDDCYINYGTTPRNLSGSLVSYAAANWGHHAREAEEEQTTQVLTGAFLNKLCWRRPPVTGNHALEEMKIPQQLGLGAYFPDWTALHVLAYFGIVGKAQRAIEKGSDVNAQDNCMGITPLHCAAHRGHEEMVELLLDHRANINATCKDGSTAMHLAAEQGQRRIMRLLLIRRANSRTANRQGLTALQMAAGTAYDEATVPLLIKSRSDMDAQNATTGNSMLHVAVEQRRIRILLFLLERGASTNVFNKQGLNPLQLAAKTDNREALSLLLERGAKVEACSLFGSRPSHVAASAGNWVSFDLLLIGGADINAWDNNGEALLHEQARRASSPAIAAHLLEQGANIEARTSQGYTPLQCAAMSGNKRMFFFLVGKGAKVDIETSKGETLLHLTPPSNQDCMDILAMLLKMSLEVEALNSNGWTPLQQTVFVGTGAPDIEFDKTSEYIELLISYGADINAAAESPTGETALHLATMAAIPRPLLVTFLIKHGASVNCRTFEGKTPLHLAAERGRDSIFQALLAAGADLSIKVSSGTSSDDGSDMGKTPLDIARKHPMGALWFDDMGNLQLSVDESQPPTTMPTPIEIETDSETDDDDDDDETGGSTLVEEEGSQWGSATSTQVITIIE